MNQRDPFNGGQRVQDGRIENLEKDMGSVRERVGRLEGKYVLLVSLQVGTLVGIIGLIGAMISDSL